MFDVVKEIEWLKFYFIMDEGVLIVSVYVFVVEIFDCWIVVDICIGNDKIGWFLEVWNNL